MNPITFLTGNEGKLREIQAILPNITGMSIDLPEIQEIDPHRIISAKLREARKHHAGSHLVEDTSLYIDAMNGLPGPLIKWFLQSIGVEGIYKLTDTFGTKATARTIIGYCNQDDENIHFFEGSIGGDIVIPRGRDGFGWDSIFQPKGREKTFAEMTALEKNQLSMRRQAAQKLGEHLKRHL